MAEDSNIEWTKHTFNPWRGCTRISIGCKNCYAETLSYRNPGTLGVWGPNGTRVVASESMWKQPLTWDRKAKAAGERHRVFCASLADVFEDWSGPEGDGAMTCHKTGESLSINGRGHVWPMGWPSMSDGDDWMCRPYTMNDVRKRLFHLIESTPNLDWLLLTKRPENVLRMTHDEWCPPVPGHVSQNAGDGHAWKFPPNVWVGTSVENQEQADFRIPHLLRVPAKVRFLSCEPLLGPVDLTRIPCEGTYTLDALRGRKKGGVTRDIIPTERIHWVITGGESGDGYRDCDPKWQADIMSQCEEVGVSVFVKQDAARKPGQQGRLPLAVWQHKEFPK